MDSHGMDYISAAQVIIDVPTVYQTANATYMAFRSGGLICPAGSPAGADLMSIKLIPGSPPSWETAWCAVQNGTGSPMSTSADNQTAVVWGLGAETSNQLKAFNGDTGELLFTSEAVPGVSWHNPPFIALTATPPGWQSLATSAAVGVSPSARHFCADLALIGLYRFSGSTRRCRRATASISQRLT